MPWEPFIVADLAGVDQGELSGAKDRSVALPVGSFATLSGAVNLDHEHADFLLEGDAIVKAYERVPDFDQPQLRAACRLVTADETVTPQGGTVAFTAADPFWVLLRRLIGKSQSGYTNGSAVAPVDRGTIIGAMVDATNGEDPSGVRMGTVEASSKTWVEGWYYKKIGEAIAELCATLDGPDWLVRALEFEAPGYYGALEIKPAIGQPREHVAFEHGDGLLNVKGYRRAVSLEGTANRAFHLPPGFPDNAAQQPMQEDDATSQDRRGLLEDVVAQDLSTDDLRRKLLQHHISVRANPRQTITFDPVRDPGDGSKIPTFGVEWDRGDVVPFRASIERDGQLEKRIDALFRVYQVEFRLDDTGEATPTVTLSPSQ